jgi:hypothetical protein
MYKAPIIIASFVFVIGTVVEGIAIEVLRGSVVEWLTQPHKVPLLLAMIGMNAMQASLFGYAAHRAARNALLWRRAEWEHRELTLRLRYQLRPALSIVQYAAYKTSDKQCIEICNQAISRVVNTVAAVETEP